MRPDVAHKSVRHAVDRHTGRSKCVRYFEGRTISRPTTSRGEKRSAIKKLQWSAFAAIALIGAAALVVNLGLIGGSAAAQPQPILFSQSETQTVTPILASARQEAEQKTAAWLHLHPSASVADFESWAIEVVGPPPAAKTQSVELRQLHDIARTRTPTGNAAAQWLEKNGKKSVWKAYAKQYGAFVSKAQGKAAKAQLKQTLAVAKDLSAKAQARYPRTSPYEVDQSLSDPRAAVDQTAALTQLKATGVRRVSYPSKHALISAAASSLLSTYEPPRAPEFKWMNEQVDYSRLYAAGHFPSDVRAGALLGYMLADYELHSTIGAGA